MKKLRIINLLLTLVILAGGAYYWNWHTFHNIAIVSAPTIAETDKAKDINDRPPKKASRVNILVLGTDNRGNEVARSDTMMLVSANVDTHQVAVISIPRDTRVELPGVGFTKINHANAVGEVRGGVREGTLASAKATSNLLGIPINYYVKIDFQGFEKAVDSVGGIDVTLPNPVSDKMNNIQLSAGDHHLTGDQALRLSRARFGLANGDFDRQRDQFYLLSALADQMLSLSNITKLPEVLNIVHEELMDTNMSVAEMGALGLKFKGITKEEIKYYQLPGKGISAQDPLVGAKVYYYEPDLDGVKQVVQQALADAQLAQNDEQSKESKESRIKGIPEGLSN